MYEPGFWEREAIFNNIDVCIIGSGIVGLNAAINLKSKAKGLNVLVVDSGFLPHGASTRNAGFACFGSLTELIDDLKNESEDAVLKRIQLRWEGLKKLRKLVGDANLDFEPFGGHEIFTPSDAEVFEECQQKITYFNRLVAPVTGVIDTYKIEDRKIDSFGFSGVNHVIVNQCEGQINTGKMMNALLEIAHQSGVKIINGLGISAVKNTNNKVEINCIPGFSFSAKRVLVANNGFASALLPELEVLPARAQVLITHPVANLQMKGSFHYEKGFYYFRNVGDRVLLGGGRNLNFEKETTTSFGTTPQIQDQLDRLLKEMILPQTKFTIDMRWSGIMGVGTSKSTILKCVEGNIFCSVRMGGMGIAIGSRIGELGAQLILDSL